MIRWQSAISALASKSRSRQVVAAREVADHRLVLPDIAVALAGDVAGRDVDQLGLEPRATSRTFLAPWALIRSALSSDGMNDTRPALLMITSMPPAPRTRRTARR
jgi:hypothetical protein